ncbi:hypothetical protein N7467_011399 [Penicillium canescens]|nr:hypothetical protein N7467_011399 [Penicillium canescens]
MSWPLGNMQQGEDEKKVGWHFSPAVRSFKGQQFKRQNEDLEYLSVKGCWASPASGSRSPSLPSNNLRILNAHHDLHALLKDMQFGNILVLSATYRSNLHALVDADLLKLLLRRIVGFLTQSEDISPTLRADARILIEVYQLYLPSRSSDEPLTDNMK